jgi:hypothetical protein
VFIVGYCGQIPKHHFVLHLLLLYLVTLAPTQNAHQMRKCDAFFGDSPTISQPYLLSLRFLQKTIRQAFGMPYLCRDSRSCLIQSYDKPSQAYQGFLLFIPCICMPGQDGEVLCLFHRNEICLAGRKRTRLSNDYDYFKKR